MLRQLAATLALAPLVVLGVIRLFGGRPFVLHWEGSLFQPKSIGVEFHNIGLLLVAISLAGFFWLICFLVRWLWASLTSHAKRA